MVPTLTPAFIIPEGIGGGISGGGQNVALSAAGVVAAGVIVGGLVVVAAPVVAAVAAKASLLTAASPLGLLAVGAFLKGLQQFRDWGLTNYRPQPSTPQPPAPGTEWFTGGTTNATIVVRYEDWVSQGTRTNSSGVVTAPATEFASNLNGQFSLTGIGVRIGSLSNTQTNVTGPGTNTPSAQVAQFTALRADGSTPVVSSRSIDKTEYNKTFNRVDTSYFKRLRIFFGGVEIPLDVTTPQDFAPGTRPQLFPQTLPDAPILPAPGAVPAAPILPPAPPDRRPLAPPVTVPRPGQDPARVPVPGPRPGPTPSPGPSPTPQQPAPAGVPAVGPLPLPIPLPVPTTPGSVVIVDGQPIGGPGQAPAPNLVAIAQELGRLERKNEILLSRPENGGLGEVAENAILGTLRSLLERLVTELLNDVPGGSFSLSHACPPPGGGDPLPPVVVPYDGGGNPTAGILARLDGLAGLIQAHKSMRQPICRTPLVGEEVTIHFESDG